MTCSCNYVNEFEQKPTGRNLFSLAKVSMVSMEWFSRSREPQIEPFDWSDNNFLKSVVCVVQMPVNVHSILLRFP